MTIYGSVRNLFAGKPLAQPPENDDVQGNDDAGKPNPAPSATGPTEEQVQAVVASEIKARDDRWNKVMTSPEGSANPKAAARLLTMAGGAATADEVIATLADMGTPAPAQPEGQAPATPSRAEQERADLAADDTARPDTGPAGGGRGARTGEGADSQARKDRRAARIAKDNARLAAKGGKQVENSN